MSDIEGVLCNAIDGGCCATWRKLILRLALVYLLVAFLCWREVRFRSFGVDAVATVEFVRPTLKHGRELRYSFLDPDTGRLRQNTVPLRASLPPTTATIPIEFIPGAFATSRPKAEARPWVVTTFVVTNLVLLAVAGGWLIVEARAANRRPLTRQQRAVREYRLRAPRVAG